jgi:PAS domain S-box-containing protein
MGHAPGFPASPLAAGVPRAVFRSASDGIALSRASDGTVIDANPAFCELNGFEFDELIGKTSVETRMLASEDERQALMEVLRRDGSLGPIATTRDNRLGVTHTVEYRLELVDSDGEELVVTMCRDVTELRASERRTAALMREVLQAEERERVRVAGELHDDTIQVMTATLLAIDRLVRALEQGEHDREAVAARAARDLLAEATERTRRLMFEIHPLMLREEGLERTVADLAERAEKEDGLKVELRVSVGRLPEVTEVLVYRTIREAVTNVRKHAQASHLVLEVEARNGTLVAAVRDDGRGFTPGDAPAHGLGLAAAADRISLVGGELSVRSEPGRGTEIELTLPLPDETS